ncbi:hypothetical protein JAAARDRAFT_37100 [Jaapia argillacea MUCL 33604]|uniref:RNA polymerase II-associated protein n=1 Tax=Jaapia argillacea MUCL 33604 TaxID=933084 RepID=A0A067PPF2_9AGAM|nr:hypothetical protein JAAARDRAFT_37100 [Jaapia argillacea MUCL 33604]
MDLDDRDYPATPTAGRTMDIEIGTQEVITIELDTLDPNPDDVLELLKEGQCSVWVWTKLAGEYWRRGNIDGADKIVEAAVDSFTANGAQASLPPIYLLRANLQIARAASAPKLILDNSRMDKLQNEKPKEEYYRGAATSLNLAIQEPSEFQSSILSFLTRGAHQLATNSLEDALRSFEGVLAQKPTNIVALMGKARILLTRRQFPQALKIFQQVLQYNPQCLPDPRIGIGLCLWSMDHKAKAKAAWHRSIEVNPTGWVAQLLLGLEAVNSGKDESKSREEREHFLVAGTTMIEKAFRANNKSAAAANALADVFLRRGNQKTALKLAERAIQYADTRSLITEGYIRAGRVSHAEGSTGEAMKHYNAAVETYPKHIVGSIGLAQMQMLNNEMPAAIHSLDNLLQPPNPQRSLEAMVMLASLRVTPRPGVSASELTQEKARARDALDKVAKELHLYEDPLLQANGLNANSIAKSARELSEDMDMHAEVARLWQEENLDRTGKALREALRISESTGQVDPRLLNNLGTLHHLDGNLAEARGMYERALVSASQQPPEIGEGMSTSILYNLARVYEEQGDESMAKEAYDKLLTRHPEYVDAKIRQAQMLADLNRSNDAHELLKQALSSQNGNLNLRAYYTHFLIQANLPKPAKEFVFATLKDHDKHDIYSLCAAGWIMYHQARESRDLSPKGADERRRGFQRAAEFFEKSLQLDPMCAFAAQALAIVTAEDALGSLSGGAPSTSGTEEAQKRFKNARDALEVFAKVRESISDGSVYFNMGHCHYARDDYDRAVESYETANRFYNGHNAPVLLCLCRSWYAKANKDQSFVAMNTALGYAQKALHLQPSDKAILYNIAMIQQKAAEMMFALPHAKRSLAELQRAIEHAGHAQKLFASLAADPSSQVPYSKDIADQRRKYGDGMLRKVEEHLVGQRQYEAEAQAKLDTARQKRQEEKERLETLEYQKMAELRRQAEELAEERRKAREQALQWSREVKMESDEEREKQEQRRSRKAARKPKGEGSGDEGGPAPEPKKKKRVRKKDREGEAGEVDGDDALFSEEEGEKAVKKRPKKRAVRDDDDEEVDGAGQAPRKKMIKSKEYIEDSDEEMS